MVSFSMLEVFYEAQIKAYPNHFDIACGSRSWSIGYFAYAGQVLADRCGFFKFRGIDRQVFRDDAEPL
jgi:hypothetical protein